MNIKNTLDGSQEISNPEIVAKSSPRIQSLGFWRFFFAMAVALGHAVNGTLIESGRVLLGQGGMAIHFFAILSGYLLVHSCYKYGDNISVPKATYKYTVKKVKKFLPYCWIALAVTCAIRIREYVIHDNYQLIDIFRWLDGIWPEWLMVNSVFYNDYNSNGAT